MLHRVLRSFVFVVVAGCLAWPVTAGTVSRIRVMLHPYAAAPGQLPPSTLDKLQALAGSSLELSSITRTGALEFALPAALDPVEASIMLRRLRVDRTVLWAEAVASLAVKSQRKSSTTKEGQRLLVRLLNDTKPDWAALLARWSDIVGVGVSVERLGGNAWVIKLARPLPEDQLIALAQRLQDDAAVQYADPIQRVSAHRVPNDALYDKQWALSDALAGVNAPAGWDVQTGSPDITVAVLDTGITQHPDLAGRILPGYDFVSDPAAANDGDGRDADPSDPGDGTTDNECGDGAPGERSFFHGTFVSGIVAANTDNGIGVSGIDWNAKILPVRVLGKCGGSFEDVIDGLLWSAGLPVPATPPNPHPARVINMSLGGFASCPQAMQDAVNAAMAQGAVIVVSAGNSADDAANFAPANCSGVITVGGSTRQGDRTSYSNFGARIDVSAPGGDGDRADWILSTSNDGQGAPGNPDYEPAVGTSFSAPFVSGTLSLMLARNPNLTPGRMLDIVSATARDFALSSPCIHVGLCGAGLLDAGLALQSTLPGFTEAPAGTAAVVEFYRADRDHYFISADPAEIAILDTSLANTWQRTGEVFFAWTNPVLAPVTARPVCRFYASSPLIDSHFYSAIGSECQYVVDRWPGIWALENPAIFYVLPVDATGQCEAGALPVYRFFNNRRDANHRHTVDLTVRRAMINRAWVPEGIGPNNAVFCSPF